MQKPPLATIGGIPVRVDSSFLLGAFIIFLWSGGGTAGIYTIAAMAIFVLIHELGHAVSARRFGANSEITMSFLGGYTSFSSSTRLTRLHNIVISGAGAALQLAVALPALWLAYRWLSSESLRSFELGRPTEMLNHAAALYTAISWAGILLAFLNLIPALPLDGGLIVEALIRPLTKQRTDEIMKQWSLGVAGALVLAYLFTSNAGGASAPQWTPQKLMNPTLGTMLRHEAESVGSFVLGGSLLIPMFIALGVFARQPARAPRRPVAGHAPSGGVQQPMAVHDLLRATSDAERRGWETGLVGEFPAGGEPSPWLIAYAAERRGDARTAADALYALDDARPRKWSEPPDPAHPSIVASLDRLPDSVRSSSAVLRARVHAGSADALAAAATDRYQLTGDVEALYLGAAGFAARGLTDAALSWAEQAVLRSPRVDLLETLAPFGLLRGNPVFEGLVDRARRTAES